ncbi:hypothetical protein B0H10DRAFT_1830679, partial [Mycena sp. CBHHK59/15]
WYFTQEGCADVAENLCSLTDDTFGPVKVEDRMALHSLASSCPSKNVVKHKDLTWRLFNVVKNTMLIAI